MNQLSRLAIVIFALSLLLIVPQGTRAFDDYSDSTCETCHGSFVDRGTLHDNHLMVTNNCGLCHPSNPGSKPVNTSVSADGSSCLGCHGRDYGGSIGQQAAGLRVKHGSCSGCHPSDPTPLAEVVAPVHYARGDVNVKDPCSSAGPPGENFWNGGLDNDGDGLYNEADPDCNVAVEVTTWGQIKAIYE